MTINSVVLEGRKERLISAAMFFERFRQFKMQFKVIASILFFVAQTIMATPTENYPRKPTHPGSDICTWFCVNGKSNNHTFSWILQAKL